MFIRNLCLIASCTLITASPIALAADSFPTKPITVVVPYAAGGSTDQLARMLQGPMSDYLKQPVLIENKPGAGGMVATADVARASPDGYTLVFGNIGPNAVMHLMRKMSYDPVTDFKPISLVAKTPLFFAVPETLPVSSMDEFLAYAKKNPGAVNYGSVGVGSFSHLAGEHFKEQAGLDIVHVPYGGGAPMAVALASGDIQFAMVTGLDGGAIMKTGKVKYLAVGADERSPALLSLPTISESVPGYTAASWFGVLAPSGVSDVVVQRLNEAVVHAVSQPQIQQRFASLNIEAAGTSALDFANLISDEVKLWRPIIERAKISLD